MTHDLSPLDGALKMASLGYEVFLLKDYGTYDQRKTPLNNGWQNDATTDPDTIKELFNWHPDANYGVKLGPRDIALDFDEVSESRFKELQAWLRTQIGFDDETFTQLTASQRGYHILLKTSDGVTIKNNPNFYRRGDSTIELRSHGYYIVGPYSRIGNAVYTPLTPFKIVELTPGQCEKLAVMSNEWKREKIFGSNLNDKIPTGSRHNTLMSFAGSLRRKGLGYESILGMLDVANKNNCIEPLPSEELCEIARFVVDKPPEMTFGALAPIKEPAADAATADGAIDGRPDIDLSGFPTQMGVAEWFAHEYHDTVRYCAKWKKWLAYDGKHWSVGADGADVRVQYYIKNRAKEIYQKLLEGRYSLEEQKELAAFARRLQQTFFIKGVLEFAKNEPELQINPEELNANKWLFNVDNGTIELKTRSIREHRPEDYITYAAPVTYDPSARSDIFDAFITRVMPDALDRQSLQQIAYIGLTGQAYEIFIIFYGTGANGKTTFLGAIASVMGPYAKEVNPDILLQKKHESHPTEKANLYGVRLATTRETNRQQKLDSAKLKDVASTDRISARRMHEDFWEFDPTHITVMRTNHKPIVTSFDIGSWRRLALVPWKVTLPESEWDLSLGEKLAEEHVKSAVLNWILEGGQHLKNGKFDFSPNIRKATKEYQVDSDVFGQFFDQHYIKDEDGRVQAKEIRDLYNSEHPKQPISYNRLSDEMLDHGFTRINVRGSIFWLGFKNRESTDDESNTLLEYDEDVCGHRGHLSGNFPIREDMAKNTEKSPKYPRTTVTPSQNSHDPAHTELSRGLAVNILSELQRLRRNPFDTPPNFGGERELWDFVISSLHDQTGVPRDTIIQAFDWLLNDGNDVRVIEAYADVLNAFNVPRTYRSKQ